VGVALKVDRCCYYYQRVEMRTDVDVDATICESTHLLRFLTNYMVDSSTPSFTPIGTGVGVWAPRLIILPKF